MTIVERLYPGFQWAEPARTGQELEVEQVGSELHVTGIQPRYKDADHPSDLIRQYERAAKHSVVGKKRAGTDSPGMLFANASTDEKLITFVRRFGPVVAKEAYTNFEKPEKGLSEPRLPPHLFAVQDMQELRNEHSIYRSVLALVRLLNEPDFDYLASQSLIKEIAGKIVDWPRQWEREKSQRKGEPFWTLKVAALRRIESLKSGPRDVFLPPALDGRIVICELLNCFPAIVFPNPVEMHRSIKCGIRPLLYALIRRQFLGTRDFALCANTQCRNFFNIERSGQKFCSSECSLKQRQRIYWANSGKKLRRKRLRDQRKKRE